MQYGNTALQCAADRGHVQLCLLLVASGANGASLIGRGLLSNRCKQAVDGYVAERRRHKCALLGLRRAHEAHRDARLVFRAAAEGRPLEL